jgi:hypothetical protein
MSLQVFCPATFFDLPAKINSSVRNRLRKLFRTPGVTFETNGRGVFKITSKFRPDAAVLATAEGLTFCDESDLRGSVWMKIK